MLGTTGGEPVRWARSNMPSHHATALARRSWSASASGSGVVAVWGRASHMRWVGEHMLELAAAQHRPPPGVGRCTSAMPWAGPSPTSTISAMRSR